MGKNKTDSITRIATELYSDKRNADSEFVINELELCRRENAKPVVPPPAIAMHSDSMMFGEMPYFIVHPNDTAQSNRIVIYLHGGAYIYQPVDAQWNIARRLARALECDVVMPIYLKAPNYTCKESVGTLLDFHINIVEPNNHDKDIVFVGDSAGGSLCLTLAQEIKKTGHKLPKHIIMFSPSTDLSFAQEDKAREIEPSDPMLQINRLKLIVKSWIGDLQNTDTRVSPIFGDLNVGMLTLFTGTHEILFPDAQLLKAKAEEQGLAINYFEYPDMFHDFILFPLEQAKDAFGKTVDIIKG